MRNLTIPDDRTLLQWLTYGAIVAGLLLAAMMVGRYTASLSTPMVFGAGMALLVFPLSRVIGTSLYIPALIATLISDLFLGDIDIGPFSLRIYLILGMGLMMMAEVATRQRKLFRSRIALNLTLVYLTLSLIHISEPTRPY